MNTNMTGFWMFFKNPCIFVTWVKVASALEGLRPLRIHISFSSIAASAYLVGEYVSDSPKQGICSVLAIISF